jgi:hypothetical protein
VQQYDHDKHVPMYGFGARVGGSVKHAFALNFNEADPEVEGVNGMLAAYQCVTAYVAHGSRTRVCCCERACALVGSA